MTKTIIAVSVLLSLGSVQAMADMAHHRGTPAQADRVSGLTYAETHGHVTSTARADLEICEGYESGRDGVYPYECAVGTRSNGSDGGSDGDSASY